MGEDLHKDGSSKTHGHYRIYPGASFGSCESAPSRRHKLIERRLIRPRRLRTGRSIQRMLSRGQVLYLRLEAEGVRLLPLAARRAIAKKIESSPEVDAVVLTEGSAVVIQVKSVRLELEENLLWFRSLAQHTGNQFDRNARPTSKPSRAAAVRFLALGGNENRFLQPDMAAPLRGDNHLSNLPASQ